LDTSTPIMRQWSYPCLLIGIATLHLLYFDLQLFERLLTCPIASVVPRSILSPTTSTTTFLAQDSTLRLRLGDLPGYTGWARPPFTWAHGFSMVQATTQPTVGQNLTIMVHCSYDACHKGGSLFYVRAYGSSILPGQVVDYKNGSYDFVVIPHDPGTLVMEVVLTFSQVPPMISLPSSLEPGYEGYLLPDFPMTLNVADSTRGLLKGSQPSSLLPFCNNQQLVETSPSSALQSGRWVLTEKVSHTANITNGIVNSTRDFPIHRKSFESGWNSLGFRMDYHYLDCQLVSESKVRERDTLFQALHSGTANGLPHKPLHFVFIGDSNTRIQSSMFQDYFGGISVTYIPTNGGLVVTLEPVQQALDQLQLLDDHFFVVFNAGLHSIFELCDSSRASRRAEYMNITNDFSCVATYRDAVQQLIQAVHAFPAMLKVWQTTMAAWPKWGVPSAAWPWRYQMYPLDMSGCEAFNQIVWDVLISHDDDKKMVWEDIHVMDTYWLTYARPDHRQVDAKNSLTGRLMHAGPEVYSVLTRKWAHMILNTIANYGKST
jgi:hypothetical protein